MKVILLQRIEKLGQMGDVVTVKPGYARNFLLPSGRARRATAANLKGFESERAQLEVRNIELKSEGAAIGDKLAGQVFVAIRQAGDSGQLFGSVSTRDIADLVTAGGFSVSRGQIVLRRPIKMLGLHPVRVALHPEVSVEVTVNVARSEEEAKRQARGEDVTIEQTDEEIETEIALAELFEDEVAAEQALSAAASEEEELESSEPVATSPDDPQETVAAEETEDAPSS